jgi:hypothetical protein
LKEKKEKNPQSQTLAKMRHPGTYLGLSMLDLTSSEFGKGTRGSPAPTLGLIGSGSRLRASQRDCLTMVRSPVSRRATAPLLRPVATSAASLVRSGEDGGGERMKWLGLWGKCAAQRFCSAETRTRPSIQDGRRTTFWAR